VWAFSFATLTLVRWGLHVLDTPFRSLCGRIYKVIRDDNYLVGRRLQNRRPQTEDVAPAAAEVAEEAGDVQEAVVM
jgi:hypothetical protein